MSAQSQDPPPASVPRPLTAADPTLTPPKTQRRPLLIALSIVLIAVGALLAAYLTTVVGNTVPVVAVRTDVPRGAVIERGDLVEARINPDPALVTVPFFQVGTLVGRRAAADLHAGGLVSPTSITDTVTPAAGQTLVGVALTRAQLPTRPLQAGDQVRIVYTPRSQDPLPTKKVPTIKATVVSTADIADGTQVVVDLTIPTATAENLAALAATGRVALIVDGTL